jgi:pantothenate kinase-related protein Tda10
MQPGQVASEIQTRSRTRQQQESSANASSMHEYERTIEENFQNHIKPYLQLYLEQTRRSDPINCVFDMSNCFENQ